MPGKNLTRLEAEVRAKTISTESYQIKLDLSGGAKTFRSETTVKFSAETGAATFIDAITAKVYSVTLNGCSLDPATVSDGQRIILDDLKVENTLTVISDCEYTHSGEGLHRFVDPVDNEVYLYTQFEVPDSRRVFSVFEQPDLKATFQFTIIAPANWQVVSNSTTPTKTPTPANASYAMWKFAATPRISSYITALIAGPYSVARSELTSRDGRVIPLGAYCRASLAEHLDADYIFEKTRQGFKFFEEKFDLPYPFAKYDQLFVPEFNAGAMENAGAVTFTEFYVFRSRVTDAVRERRVVTILHELAHMWFGDLVTMRWWNDLWLNESFAEWASTIATAQATEWTEAWTTFNAMEKTWAYHQDQLPSTHPIVATINDLEDVLVNFDGITYAKGGSVLKQLAAWVGEDEFFRGVSSYFKKHAWGNTTLNDLLLELERESGRELSNWSRQWLETAGVNTLRPVVETDSAGKITSFKVLQTAPSSHPTLRPHRIALGCYNSNSQGTLVREFRHEFDIDGAETEVPELFGKTRPELLLLNDDDLTYTKIRLDESSHRTALAKLRQIEDPLTRALLWGAVWDATRDAEISATDYLRLVLDNIAEESESTTIRVVLSNAVLAASGYTAPEHQDEARRTLADTLWWLAQQAKPGTDAQFQFVLNFAALAEASSHVDHLVDLYEERLVLPGLTVDDDLGWKLLIALVAADRKTEADIESRLTTDNTATGQQSAANARAAIPTATAKERAWSSLIENESLSNTIVRETTEGFLRAPNSLLTPFLPRYFAIIKKIWADRSYAIAEKIVDGLYLSPLANIDLAEASRAWLLVNPTPPALNRLVTERLAGVDRALAAQKRDTQA